MMDIKEQRRMKFEESYNEKFGRLPQNWDESLDKYFDAHGQSAWWAWNAALDSVEIELPETKDCRADIFGEWQVFEQTASEYRAQVKEVIEDAGLKVKQ